MALLPLLIIVLAQESIPPAIVGGATAVGGVGLGGWVVWYLLSKHVPELIKTHADERAGLIEQQQAERVQLSEQNRQDRADFLAELRALDERHRQERIELRTDMMRALQENTSATRELVEVVRKLQGS